MKILFCNKYNFPFSGTEVYLFELMDLLREQGHEVALFSMENPQGEPTPYDQYFVRHIDFKSPAHGPLAQAGLAAHAVYSTEARHRLSEMIRVFQPDIAHVRNIYHHLSPSILWELKAQGVPVLYHLNDFKILCPAYNFVVNGHTCEQPCTGQFWRSLFRGCYAGPASALALVAEAHFHHWLRTYPKCVDHFLTPSRFAKKMLAENGFDGDKITVLPHFQKLPEKIPASAAPDAPILYFGRLSAEKGVADLLQAMRLLPEVRLQIAGDGPLRSELENLGRTLQINVDFTGHVRGAALDQLIASSRLTVLPSRAYETLGKSILESYAWGRPVVATDLGSRRELVCPGETGLLYEVGNVLQLAEALSTLIANPRMTAEMGAAGRRLVETQHTPAAHCEAITQLYESMRRPVPQAHLLAPQGKKLRVAFIGARGVGAKYSGIETYYEEVGERLAAMGHEVTAYCRTYFTPAQPMYREMRVVRLPTIRSKHLETVLHTLLSSIHVMFSHCDVVHYHALGPALFSLLPRLFGKKTVVTVQGLDWQRKKWGRTASLVLRLGEVASARLPNRTMVVSQVLQERYRRRFGLEPSYVPNGTVIRALRAPETILEWGLEPKNYVLFLGRFSPEKNCRLLIEAFEHLETSAKLVLAGGSSYTDIYTQELLTHRSNRIVFLDWVAGSALDELLTNAAVFVLPSDLEGLSLALLDAMGAGVCVLASDIAENIEVAEGVGFTFRRGDVQDLERMLRLLLLDTEGREAAGRAAQQRVRERYLWPGIAAQVDQLYTGLMQRKPVASVRPEAVMPFKAKAKPPHRAA